MDQQSASANAYLQPRKSRCAYLQPPRCHLQTLVHSLLSKLLPRNHDRLWLWAVCCCRNRTWNPHYPCPAVQLSCIAHHSSALTHSQHESISCLATRQIQLRHCFLLISMRSSMRSPIAFSSGLHCPRLAHSLNQWGSATLPLSLAPGRFPCRSCLPPQPLQFSSGLLLPWSKVLGDNYVHAFWSFEHGCLFECEMQDSFFAPPSLNQWFIPSWAY